MQFIQRLASQFSNTNRQARDDAAIRTMSSSLGQQPNSTAAFIGSGWSFNDLDKENQLDEDGDIVITGQKRNGEFQELKTLRHATPIYENERRLKRVKFEDDGSGERSEDLKNGVQLASLTAVDTPRIRNEVSAETNIKFTESVIPTTPNAQRTSGGTRNLPFIIEDDSEDEVTPPSPPSSSRTFEFHRKPQQRLPAAEEEAARIESRRLRQKAEQRKRNLNPSKDDDTRLEHHNGNDNLDTDQYRGKASPSVQYLGKNVLSGSKPSLPTVDVHNTPTTAPSSVSKSSDLIKTYTPRTARDPADVKCDLAKRLDFFGAKPGIQHPNKKEQRVESAWSDAEMARRAAAANARKDADAKRDAEWQAKQAQERTEERRRYEEQKNAMAAAEQTIRKAHTTQQDDLSVRYSALDKLQQANKLKKPARIERVDSVSPERKSTKLGEEVRSAALHLASLNQEPKAAGNGTAAWTEINPRAAAVAATTSKEPPIDSSADKERQERIKKQQERNARLRQAELDHEEELSTLELDLCISNEPPKIPCSLNSLGGQQSAVQSESQAATSIGSGLRGDPRAVRGKAHERALLPILPQDIKLLEWIQHDGRSWEAVEDLYLQNFGARRSRETLRKRQRQVKHAIDLLGADTSLLHSLLAGDADALATINKDIKVKWPDTRESEILACTSHVDRVFQSAPRHEQSGVKDDASLVTRDANSALLTATTSGALSVPPPPSAATPANQIAKPSAGQYAGKTWGPELWKHILDSLAKEGILEDDVGPATKEDRCHYAYQVQRRQITNEDMEGGLAIDDTEWITIRGFYDSLGRANKAAARAIARTTPGHEHVASKNGMLTFQEEDGLKSFEMTGERGVAQTRVIRFMHTYAEGSLPRDESGMISRSVYSIMERTETTNGDGIFNERRREIREGKVSKRVYTSLEMANADAVKRYVKLGFTPSSVNLDTRDMEIRALESELLCQLDEDEGDTFYETLRSEDGTEERTIWVEEERLEGPRNIK